MEPQEVHHSPLMPTSLMVFAILSKVSATTPTRLALRFANRVDLELDLFLAHRRYPGGCHALGGRQELLGCTLADGLASRSSSSIALAEMLSGLTRGRCNILVPFHN
jgi:hypothetical protein